MSSGVQPVPSSQPASASALKAIVAVPQVSNGRVALITLLLVVGSATAAIYLSAGMNWMVSLATMFIFLLCLGSWICGRPLGILITERNLMSLSRFQIVLWSLLVLSAYWTMSLARVHAGLSDALNIPMDWRLWAVMGISTTSLISSPMILDSKKRQDPSPAALTKSAAVLQEDVTTIDASRHGSLYSNVSATDARFTDIFQGDEVGNTAYVDVAKLQMFFFTLVVAGTYAYQVFHAMYAAPEKLQMPGLSDGAVALLGISHAGYLGGKAVNYTPPKS